MESKEQGVGLVCRERCAEEDEDDVEDGCRECEGQEEG